jgi:transcription termination factor Rho
MKLARYYRKQFLQLKAEQQRQALKQELNALLQPVDLLQQGLLMSRPQSGLLGWLRLARLAVRAKGWQKPLAMGLGVMQIIRTLLKRRR